jgi:hypothetical protein
MSAFKIILLWKFAGSACLFFWQTQFGNKALGSEEVSVLGMEFGRSQQRKEGENLGRIFR